MTQIGTTRSSTPRDAVVDPDRSLFPRQLMIFLALAMCVGWPMLTLSTFIRPDGPFVIAAMLFGLALPALVLTHRQAGRAGVRALLRDCVRLPTRWWWLLLAAFGLPAVTFAIGAALGGAQPLTWSLLASYTADLIVGALVINIWEEMASFNATENLLQPEFFWVRLVVTIALGVGVAAFGRRSGQGCSPPPGLGNTGDGLRKGCVVAGINRPA